MGRQWRCSSEWPERFPVTEEVRGFKSRHRRHLVLVYENTKQCRGSREAQAAVCKTAYAGSNPVLDSI